MQAFRLSIMQCPTTLWGFASGINNHLIFHDTGNNLVIETHSYDVALDIWGNRIRKADGSYWSMVVDPSKDCPSPCDNPLMVMEVAIIRIHAIFRCWPTDRSMEMLLNRWSVSGQAADAKIPDFLFASASPSVIAQL
jgi:hypothetical protein